MTATGTPKTGRATGRENDKNVDIYEDNLDNKVYVNGKDTKQKIEEYEKKGISLLPRDCSLDLFFQAEDGIRDGHVTGVQTCALPISLTELVVGGIDLGLDTVNMLGHALTGNDIGLADDGNGYAEDRKSDG